MGVFDNLKLSLKEFFVLNVQISKKKKKQLKENQNNWKIIENFKNIW